MADKPRILIADDEPAVRKVMVKRLEQFEFEVMAAEDGEEALAMIRHERPDLIILDVMMPKKNGYEVCSILKRDEKLCMIPVIMFTAKDARADQVTGVMMGADAYVPKDCGAKVLLEHIRGLLTA
jgi:two-component system, OmpR family, alkaline phosphatase synthesis response regulator PhoP